MILLPNIRFLKSRIQTVFASSTLKTVNEFSCCKVNKNCCLHWPRRRQGRKLKYWSNSSFFEMENWLLKLIWILIVNVFSHLLYTIHFPFQYGTQLFKDAYVEGNFGNQALLIFPLLPRTIQNTIYLLIPILLQHCTCICKDYSINKFQSTSTKTT